MNKTVIYTITSVFIEEPKIESSVNGNIIPCKNTFSCKRARLVGFYSDLEKAKTCVLEDWASFSEAGYYNYVVIERVVEGLYNLDGMELNDLDKLGEWWYVCKESYPKWIECEKPKELTGIVSFGIG